MTSRERRCVCAQVAGDEGLLILRHGNARKRTGSRMGGGTKMKGECKGETETTDRKYEDGGDHGADISGGHK
ncbi:hypothetical protein N9L68_00905 [bacterium]|nr:hypothetical protein [bacterium]